MRACHAGAALRCAGCAAPLSAIPQLWLLAALPPSSPPRQVDGYCVEVALQWCADSFSDTIIGFVNSIKVGAGVGGREMCEVDAGMAGRGWAGRMVAG